MMTTFFAAMLVATLILLVITRLAADRLIHTHYRQKTDFFAHYPIQPGDIVFLGDSITDGARWDELFPGLPVKNRGINADTTSGVLERLGVTLAGRPAAVFLLIGTNDLPWYMYRRNRDILETYAAILKRCQEESPRTQVFVQSILPRHRRYARRIQSINAGLAELAAHYGDPYIDLFPHFAGPHGEIRAGWSNDSLHLLACGYKRWVEILAPYIERLKPDIHAEDL